MHTDMKLVIIYVHVRAFIMYIQIGFENMQRSVCVITSLYYVAYVANTPNHRGIITRTLIVEDCF